MSRQWKISIWVLVFVILIGGTVFVLRMKHIWPRPAAPPVTPVTVTGSVLREDTDPKKQSPVANTRILATGGASSVTAESDASGLFRFTLRPGVGPGQPITLRFEHPEYKPLEITEVPKDCLYIIRMQPLAATPPANPQRPNTPAKQVIIKNVRVRYSVKNETTVNVGSLAKEFEVVNTGNVPCKGHQPCSPDGKWKATMGSLPLDAQPGNEFRNVRVSCIAGPCPFTRIESNDLSVPARNLRVQVLNWSDTASFLIEEEVTRTMVADVVRYSYPFVMGNAMSFALPAGAESPSIQTDLNGEEIVFPLGPSLRLSWATCSVETGQSRSRVYRCELKPGYQFQ